MGVKEILLEFSFNVVKLKELMGGIAIVPIAIKKEVKSCVTFVDVETMTILTKLTL